MKASDIFASIGGAALLAAVLLAVPAGADEPEAAFRDTFERLDESRWFISDGWTNGGVFNVGWDASLAGVEGGEFRLGLTGKPGSGRPFSAGEMQTKRFVGHGAYEVVLRAADGGPGMVTGFFVYSGPQHGTTHEEIDFEWLGANPRAVQVNYYSDGKQIGGRTFDLGFDATRTHHLYRFEWEPDRIRWYVDGALIHEEDGSRLRLPQPPAKLFTHVWAGTGRAVENWLGGRFFPPRHDVEASMTCISYVPLGEEGAQCSDLR